MTVNRTIMRWQLRTRELELGVRTRVMAIVNITPDSFSDGGAFYDTEAAIARGLQAINEGADIVDLGAESTRPGSRAGGAEGTHDAPAVSAEQEQARLLPVLRGILRERPEAIVSVDTYKASTANAAMRAGAEIVNDVSGLMWDPEMAGVCSETKAGVVLMHTRGRPEAWRGQSMLPGDEVLEMVREGLGASLEAAIEAGVRREAIVLDPGYGFGKRFGENFALLRRQSALLGMGHPLLAGLSRKSFLGHTLAPLNEGEPAPPDRRENASIAALVTAILQGASIVRVHSVRASVEAARVADAVIAG